MSISMIIEAAEENKKRAPNLDWREKRGKGSLDLDMRDGEQGEMGAIGVWNS